jgi:CRP-like cAMP-binding protein
MPEPYDLASLGLPASSEFSRLLRSYPDILARSYGDGEYLVREEDPSQDIFIILRGALVVEQAHPVPGGTPVILACLTADPEQVVIVGEMAYLGSQNRSASVRSSGRSHVLSLAPGHVDGILEGFPGLTRVICRQFSRRLRDTDAALQSLQGRFALNPRRRMASPGERLFAAGSPATELFQLVAGTVRLERDGAATLLTPDDLPMGLLEPEPFLRGGAHAGTATVEEMAFLAVIGQDGRDAVVRCFPQLVLDLLAAPRP